MERTETAVHRERLLDGLRAFGANYTELTRRFAGFLGLHSTDAAALAEILYADDKGVPLSPARLAERVSLTSGATTNLLNRLERAGHVVRIRDQADRRVVTLRASPEIQGPAQEFFGGLLVDPFDALLSQYPAETLERFDEFLTRLRGTMRDVLADEATREH